MADILKNELANDPLGRGYANMPNTEVANDLNDLARLRVRTSMSGDEIFQQTADTQFKTLTDTKKQLWLAFCARDVVDPRAAANIAFVLWVFGTGTTITNLNAARTEAISRATELGLGIVKPGHVEEVRRG